MCDAAAAGSLLTQSGHVHQIFAVANQLMKIGLDEWAECWNTVL
jgi:hypothetical protein